MPPTSLPWPAEAFLSDAAVRLAVAQQRHADIAFLILFASQSWLDPDGMLPADDNRLAAVLGLDVISTRQAKAYWKAEGKLTESKERLYLPWLTKAKAQRMASRKARSDLGRKGAAARWSQPQVQKGENTNLLPAYQRHADGTEWPKEYTKAACEIWTSRWGSGSAPGDIIASNFRTLKKNGAPWNAVIRSFQRYVDIVEDQYASPTAWRKRWRSYDPEEPEHDHEAAKVVDSMDRQRRQARRSSFGSAAKGLLED